MLRCGIFQSITDPKKKKIYIWNLHGDQPVHVPFMYHILQFLNFHYVLWRICLSSLSDWTNSFRFRTDCDEYSLVLHRRFLCTVFIVAFIVTIIAQKETKLQKLAITFHFFVHERLSLQNSIWKMRNIRISRDGSEMREIYRRIVFAGMEIETSCESWHWAERKIMFRKRK